MLPAPGMRWQGDVGFPPPPHGTGPCPCRPGEPPHSLGVLDAWLSHHGGDGNPWHSPTATAALWRTLGQLGDRR